jgi:putative membrane protein
MIPTRREFTVREHRPQRIPRLVSAAQIGAKARQRLDARVSIRSFGVATRRRSVREEKPMIELLVKVAVNAVALVVAATFVPEVSLNPRDKIEDWVMIVLIALVFAIVNTYIKPILKILAMPIGFITMGLVAFVINAAMLLGTAWLVNLPQIQDLLNKDFTFKVGGYPPTFGYEAIGAAVVASIVISIVSTVLDLALMPRKVVGL